MKKTILSLLVTLITLSITADEGMWMLNNIDPKTAQAMKSLGLQLTPRQLYDPDGPSLKDAVVDLCDFCSGVVVSPDGLMLTNHHCGYQAIQALSTPKDDILRNGFVARKRSQERPAPGYYVRFLVKTEDCTADVISRLDSISKAKKDTLTRAQVEARYADAICTQMERTFDQSHPGMECRIAPYYGGNAYYVSYYKVYRDIRLVFTATETLGKFGGDTDNWMWPRQTCDFSMFRIYADPDGNPAEYSPSNVPLRTPGYAPVSLQGYAPGDYCMTIGYPGSTDRYLSSWGIHERTTASNQAVIDVRTAKQDVWKHWMDDDRTIAIKYASKWARSSNYWKNSIGMNKAVIDLDVIGQKQKTQQAITDWINTPEPAPGTDRQARFGNVLPTLQKTYADRYHVVSAATYFRETFFNGIEIGRAASILSRMPQDATPAEALQRREALQSFYKDYDPRIDQETTATLLGLYRQKVSKDYLPTIYHTIDSLYGGNCQAYARDLFAKTCLLDTSCVSRILCDSTLRDTDPVMTAYDSILEMLAHIARQALPSSITIDHNERLLTQALIEMDQEHPHYSDANFTMRLSYGNIQDYTAHGTHYDYYTDSQSLLDKAARQEQVSDYRLEPQIVKLLRKGRFAPYADQTTGKLQLCFLSNNDITGGNSGSPMFDAQGRVIGLAFDGNWEAMAGDISFDPTLQRCIGVDIRYVLWVIDRWGKARNLINELIPQPQTR